MLCTEKCCSSVCENGYGVLLIMLCEMNYESQEWCSLAYNNCWSHRFGDLRRRKKCSLVLMVDKTVSLPK